MWEAINNSEDLSKKSHGSLKQKQTNISAEQLRQRLNCLENFLMILVSIWAINFAIFTKIREPTCRHLFWGALGASLGTGWSATAHASLKLTLSLLSSGTVVSLSVSLSCLHTLLIQRKKRGKHIRIDNYPLIHHFQDLARDKWQQ